MHELILLFHQYLNQKRSKSDEELLTNFVVIKGWSILVTVKQLDKLINLTKASKSRNEVRVSGEIDSAAGLHSLTSAQLLKGSTHTITNRSQGSWNSIKTNNVYQSYFPMHGSWIGGWEQPLLDASFKIPNFRAHLNTYRLEFGAAWLKWRLNMCYSPLFNTFNIRRGVQEAAKFVKYNQSS